MNIKEAKQQIKNAMKAYFSKNEFGGYDILTEHQRPVFLMGPPGIGKTAIMRQIADELDVGLVSYSMTHHTRQSALGLPFIAHKNYGGEQFEISEYTMSEIIASVYEQMELTGKKEGILFLDEINCVSETLAPAMLQFLQNKTFGRHKVPQGWIVVAAGNPPEYNRSVREFDIVTWDRLKRIDVEPDYAAWREYAANNGVSAAILTYLDIKKNDFYQIETTVSGKSFVTARGWEDLSRMINLYEKLLIEVDESLVVQYLQNKQIAKEFSIYYDLFNKYKSDYKIEKILSGEADDEVKQRAAQAQFDERLSLLGLLLSAVTERAKTAMQTETVIKNLRDIIREIKPQLENGEHISAVNQKTEQLLQKAETLKRSGLLTSEKDAVLNLTAQKLRNYCAELSEKSDNAMAVISAAYQSDVNSLKDMVSKTSQSLDNLFIFFEQVFDESGHEMLVLVTELTLNRFAAAFIAKYGCEKYFTYNKQLMFYERGMDIISELERSGLF